MSDGVTIIFTMNVKPEAVDGLCDALPAMITETSAFKGFGAIRIVRNGNDVTFVEQWDSEADYNAYIAWRTERGDMDGIAALVDGTQLSVWPTLVLSA